MYVENTSQFQKQGFAKKLVIKVCKTQKWPEMLSLPLILNHDVNRIN